MDMDMWDWDHIDTIEWEDDMVEMNKMSNDEMMEWKFIDRETKNENMDINWKFKVWDVVKIRIFNDPDSMHPMQHPIHFHGQRFLVVSKNGTTPTNMVWKDTALVETGEYIDIILLYTRKYLILKYKNEKNYINLLIITNLSSKLIFWRRCYFNWINYSIKLKNYGS